MQYIIKVLSRDVCHIDLSSVIEVQYQAIIKLTSSSSMFVFHFSKFILLIAHFSCRGIQNAACTTAVAPTP